MDRALLDAEARATNCEFILELYCFEGSTVTPPHPARIMKARNGIRMGISYFRPNWKNQSLRSPCFPTILENTVLGAEVNEHLY